MKNNEIKKMLVDFYNRNAYTHKYIFGYTNKGNVYFVQVDGSMLDYLTKLDKASRGAGYSLRFKPDRTQKSLMLDLNPTLLCSVEYFNAMVETSKYNRGEVFEKMITELYGQEWVKDNVPFTEDGDLTVDGVAYQLKFEKATFITEGQMMRMRAEG